MPQAKREVALQFSECCAAEVALQHWLFCSADVILTKSCAATSEKRHCNIEKAALQESGAFLPLSCGFQAPTLRQPRVGPPESANRFARIGPSTVLHSMAPRVKLFFSYSPPAGIHSPPPLTPFPGSRFRVVFESILSRDSKTTQNRLGNDRKTTRNRLLGKGVP